MLQCKELRLVFFFVLFCRVVSAQISTPTFDYVTINPDDGTVTIYWGPSSTPSVTGYVIQEELVTGQNYPIATVNITTPPYSYTFSYPKVLLEPVYFNVVAIDGAGNESLRTAPSHVTMFTSAAYDTCKSTITVKWTPYVGWGSALSGHSVFRVEDNFVITKVGDVQLGVNQLEIPGIEENRQYCYYVAANRNGGTSSLSNKICITTTAPNAPSYILGDYTRYSGSNQLELHFSIDPATVSDSYRLYRSDASNNYKFIADLNKASDGTISYTDVLPGFNIFNYKLLYLNWCNAEGVSSIPINNIVLKGRSEASNNNLTWNNFEIWLEGTNEVVVYRSSVQGTMEPIANLAANATEYSDFISSESQMTGDICYQVRAISNPDILGKINISESNIFCVNMLGEVFVPNAFTPNNDGLNDIFKPSFSILPGKYTFMIFNRYGAKVFETNDISKGWDGRLPDEGKALEGAYIYYIRMENGAGKVLEKRGNFSLIYP